MKDPPVILFDGICNLCNGAVNLIIKFDLDSYFKFTPLQSTFGQRLLLKHGFNHNLLNTFVLIDGDKCLTKSDAALYISRHLPGIWSLSRMFSLVPKPLRDWGYNIVMRNRYQWFGKKDVCMVPSKPILNRFLR